MKQHALNEELKHVEQGKASCGDSNTWTHDGTGSMHSDVTVKFAQPYKSTPLVHIGVQDAYINRDWHAYFTLNVISKDATGFTIRCTLWDNGGHRLSSLNVGWISLYR